GSMTLRLTSGDAVVLGGEARLAYHGVDRILAGTSTLLGEGGRINLTLRRGTKRGSRALVCRGGEAGPLGPMPPLPRPARRGGARLPPPRRGRTRPSAACPPPAGGVCSPPYFPPMDRGRLAAMRRIPAFLVALALAQAAPHAQAADPVFPPGSRIGIVPPEGM